MYTARVPNCKVLGDISDVPHRVRNLSVPRYHCHTVKFRKNETFFPNFIYDLEKEEVLGQCYMVKYFKFVISQLK